jgi:hypothetical protein
MRELRLLGMSGAIGDALDLGKDPPHLRQQRILSAGQPCLLLEEARLLRIHPSIRPGINHRSLWNRRDDNTCRHSRLCQCSVRRAWHVQRAPLRQVRPPLDEEASDDGKQQQRATQEQEEGSRQRGRDESEQCAKLVLYAVPVALRRVQQREEEEINQERYTQRQHQHPPQKEQPDHHAWWTRRGGSCRWRLRSVSVNHGS